MTTKQDTVLEKELAARQARPDAGCLARDVNSRFLFQDNRGIPAAQAILDVAAPDPEEVISTRSQFHFPGPPERMPCREGVADVLVETKSGRQYIIEFQLYEKPGYLSHSRLVHYGSLLVSRQVRAGDGVEKMERVCVMMITEKDVLNEGLPQYTVVPYVKETGKIGDQYAFLEHNPIYVYLNPGREEDESPAACLVRDLFTEDASKVKTPAIRDALVYLNGKGRKDRMVFETREMQEWWEDSQKRMAQLEKESAEYKKESAELLRRAAASESRAAASESRAAASESRAAASESKVQELMDLLKANGITVH